MTPSDSAIEEALDRADALMAYRHRAMCSRRRLRHFSLPQLYALMELQAHGRMMVSEVAGVLGVSAPSASAILDRMEDSGLVRRERDVADRRVVWVEITDGGRDAVSELMGVHRAEMRELLQTMTPGELDDVVRGMAALQRALDRLVAGPART